MNPSCIDAPEVPADSSPACREPISVSATSSSAEFHDESTAISGPFARAVNTARVIPFKRLFQAASVACALVYFVISKVGFEPRLALGVLSVNQVLQAAVIVALAMLPWTGRLDRLRRSRTFWLVVGLAVLLAVGAVGANNTAYAPAKPLGYLGLVIPVFAIFTSTVTNATDVRRLLIFWAVIGSAMMVLALTLLVTGNAPPRLAVFGGGSNGFARIVCTAFLLWLGLDIRVGTRRIPIWMVLSPAIGVTLLFAGSKAAILGLGLSVAVLAVLRANRRLLWGAVIGILLFASAPVWTHQIAQHANKNRGEVRMFIEPDTQDPRGSYGTRITYYQRSITFLKEARWFGVGTGEWHSIVGLPSGRRHPHNMELELACELGVLGLAWLVMILVFAGRLLRRLRQSRAFPRQVDALVVVLAFWIFNAQFNGDLLDNRWIWLTVLLLEILAIDRSRTVEMASAPVLKM